MITWLRLRVVGWIPGGVEEHNPRCGGEVEAEVTRLGRDENEPSIGLRIVEVIDHPLPLALRKGEAGGGVS